MEIGSVPYSIHYWSLIKDTIARFFILVSVVEMNIMFGYNYIELSLIAQPVLPFIRLLFAQDVPHAP